MIPVRTSLQPHVGRTPTDDRHLRSMGAAAFHQRRGLWIPEEDLQRMNDINREFAEGIGERLYGRRDGR